MAIPKPTETSKPPKRQRRTVSPVPSRDVQPGAVAAQLSTGGIGLATIETEKEESEAEKGRKQQIRDEFLSLARKRFKQSADAEAELRRDMLEDLEFYNSDQWPTDIRTERTLDKRPCLTINRLPQFVRQVVNQARQSRPAIQVNPVDNYADPDTAEVIQGICRQIERQSKAHIAYSTASECQAIMGRGWWRLLAEYAADDSFEQEIRIRRILDQFTVYPDPACGEPDYSDASYGFVIERVPKHEFDVRYGEQFARTAAEYTSIGDNAPYWIDGGAIQVAEYYYIESVKVEIADVLVASKKPGEEPTRITMLASIITKEDLIPDPKTGQPAITVLQKRFTIMRSVKWALINGVDILEGNKDRTAGRDIPGRYIPIIPVLGEELVVNGRKNLRGMIRDAKDPQRAYNFWISAETELIALAPRAPVIGAAGQFEGFEEKWNNANRRNYGYLEYNAMELNQHLVPAPARNPFDVNIAPIVQATMQADRDLKSVIGMFDASQEGSPEQSGKAIIARQRQGEDGTSHFLDNLSRSIEHTGRILVDWIPVYYDKPRMLRINGLDDQPKDVLVHANQGEAANDMIEKDDKLAENILQGRPFDLGVGRYDVSISVGPSYSSRRQESVEALIQLVQAYPALLPVCGDILTKNMDWPGARELSERLKRMVPKEAQDPEKGQQAIPPEIQQQLQQMEQQIEATLAALAEKEEIIQSKAQELAAKGDIVKMQLESAERIAAMKSQADIQKAMAEINANKAIALLESKMQEIKQLLEHAHDEKMAHTNAALTPPPPRGGSNGGNRPMQRPR